MSALVAVFGGEHLLITKGVSESVLECCGSVPAVAAATLQSRFGAGMRVVAVASWPWLGEPRCTLADERDLKLLGFMTFVDAPKNDAAASLEQLRRLGIQLKVVTG